MGSLILCHKKRARQPYVITRVRMKVYTIEELCYYVCNNLYLIDYTFMNHSLCEWLTEELELTKLAAILRNALARNCSVEQFILALLQGSDIYGLSEIYKIQGMLEKLQNQKDVMRLKYKGDCLLKRKEYASAVLVYQSIVSADRDHTVTKEFYGKIYGCLGTAYGNMFLYEEAAAAYKEGWKLCENRDMMRAYMYCCYRYMPEADYVKMLSGNPLYLSTDAQLKEELRQAQSKVNMDVEDTKLESWKKEYRRIDNM